MSAENANLKGVAQGQAASEANATPQNPVDQGTNSDAKNVQFNSADIGKREKTEFFVKIEGEEEKKKAAEKEAAKKAAAEKRVADKQKAAAKKEADYQKKEYERSQKEAAAFMKHEQNKEKRRSRLLAIKNFLFKGWHKFVVIAILLALAVFVGVIAYRSYKIRRAEKEAELPEIVVEMALDQTSRKKEFIDKYENAASFEEKSVIIEEITDYYESLDYEKMSAQEATIKILEYVNVISGTYKNLTTQREILQEHSNIPKTIEQKNQYFNRLASICDALNDMECYADAFNEVTPTEMR